jgi:hypothetical protein
LEEENACLKLSKISVPLKLIAPFPFKTDHLADAFTKK